MGDEYLKLLDAKYEIGKALVDVLNQMKETFDGLIQDLQNNCPHTELTGWLGDGEWEGRQCLRCNKGVGRMRRKIK